MATIRKIVLELDQLFNAFNDEYYNSELDKPVIAVQAHGKGQQAFGWCTTRKVWSDKAESTDYYEITICAEYLNRNFEEICATMLHEMVHLSNLQNGIQDTSRAGTYHNKKFKEIAEEHGLIISKDDKYGWTITHLSDYAKSFIKDLSIDKSVFSLSRATMGEASEGKEKKKQSMRKYICPECGLIVRATKDLSGKLLCIDCEAEFVEED